MMSKGLLFFMVLSNVVDVISTKLGFTKAAYLRFGIVLMIDACILNRARVKNTRAKYRVLYEKKTLELQLVKKGNIE